MPRRRTSKTYSSTGLPDPSALVRASCSDVLSFPLDSGRKRRRGDSRLLIWHLDDAEREWRLIIFAEMDFDCCTRTSDPNAAVRSIWSVATDVRKSWYLSK